MNILIYVLHEIQFRRDVAAGLHLHDQQFGALVLTVCAIGAKYSDDPRVFLEGANSEHSAGWKWFRQVRPIPTSLFASPSLYEIQIVCVSSTMFGPVKSQSHRFPAEHLIYREYVDARTMLDVGRRRPSHGI